MIDFPENTQSAHRHLVEMREQQRAFDDLAREAAMAMLSAVASSFEAIEVANRLLRRMPGDMEEAHAGQRSEQ